MNPADFKDANQAAHAAAQAVAMPLLSGAKKLLEDMLTASESALEGVLPKYEDAVIATVKHYAPPWTQVYVDAFISLTQPTVAEFNNRLDDQGKAGVAMAIAAVDSAIGHISAVI